MSPDRAEILRDFEAGKYDVLCNSMLLTEGWDCPSVDCIVVLRPTKVRSLYVQMVGRGLRLAEGKTHCLVLDFLWHTSRHDLVRPAAMLAKSAEIADMATKSMEDGTQMDLCDCVEQAETDVAAEREAALARQLAEMRKRKHSLVDPLQYVYSAGVVELSGYEPILTSEQAPLTDPQRQTLEKRGINPDGMCKGMAERLINSLFERQRKNLATPKQIRFLESKGFLHVGSWRFDEAKSLIDRIAANRWRIPWGINPSEYKPGSAD